MLPFVVIGLIRIGFFNKNENNHSALFLQYLHDVCLVWASAQSQQQAAHGRYTRELGDCLFRIHTTGAR